MITSFVPILLATSQTELGEVQGFGDYIAKVWEWGFMVIIAISVMMLIVGGIAHITAAGDTSRIEKARQMINGSLIAVSIALLSGVLRQWLAKPASDLNKPVLQLTDTVRLITNVINILLVLVGGVALIALLWSAYQYLTARGESEKIVQAKRAGSYALIGLGIAVGAYLIVDLVIGIWS